MTPLATALRGVEERVGDVVAARLRAIARDPAAAERERAALAYHLPEHRGALAALTADEARALLVELGRSMRGRPTSPAARMHAVKVYLDDTELAELDRRRGKTGASEWIARAAGLRG